MQNNGLQENKDALQTLWEDDAQLDRLAREAVQDAVQKHKQNGQSIVVWQNGQMVTLLPSEIPDAPTRKIQP